MSNVHAIDTGHDRLIVNGLAQLADQVRDQKLRPRRALVVLCGDDVDGDFVTAHYYGATASMPEIVGMLEIAKQRAMSDG